MKNNEESLSAEEAKKEFEEMMHAFDSLQLKNDSLAEPFNIQKDEALEEDIKQDLDKKKKKDAGGKMQEMANSMMMQMQFLIPSWLSKKLKKLSQQLTMY